jgi:hypothetical protein
MALVLIDARAESGAKALFESEGTSISMEDSPVTKPAVKKAKPKASVNQRSHFSQEDDSGGSNSYAGIQYWIDLQDGSGKMRRVTSRHVFQSGDRIKLQVKSNTSGYLYVLNEDESGKRTPLYPVNGQMSALVEPGMAYTIPPRGSIRFDDNPGNEKVTIALTRNSISGPSGRDGSSSTRGSLVSCRSSSGGTKGMFSEDDADFDCLRKSQGAGTKGMFTEEDDTSASPASYSVIPASELDNGKVLFVDFNLTHR